MIINHPNLMCVGIKQPNEWNVDGRTGVTYKVQVSDGTETVEMRCASVDVWSQFKAFKPYAVSISLTQTSNGGRLGIRAEIVGAQQAGK